MFNLGCANVNCEDLRLRENEYHENLDINKIPQQFLSVVINIYSLNTCIILHF